MIILYNARMKNRHIYIVVTFLLFLFSLPSFAGGGKVIELNSSNFSSTINGSKPVLVKFYLPTCPACEMMAPEFASAAQSVGSKALFRALDASKYPDIARKYGVQTVPTTVLFVKGQEKDRLSIFVGHEQLEQWAVEFAH